MDWKLKFRQGWLSFLTVETVFIVLVEYSGGLPKPKKQRTTTAAIAAFAN